MPRCFPRLRRLIGAATPPAAADSEHVSRLKRAGLVIFGRTNTCELGLSLTCEPQLHGPTRNPWDLDRIPGGSGGGSSASLAAFEAPLAIGTDTGGSIRIPAALCGLVGFKPTTLSFRGSCYLYSF